MLPELFTCITNFRLLEQVTYVNTDVNGVVLFEQVVLGIINSVAEAHVSELCHSLQLKIENTMEDLTCKLEKNSLPRPPQMGKDSISTLFYQCLRLKTGS